MTTRSDANARQQGTKRPRGWRLFAFPLAAVLLALLPFVALELVLRFLGVGNPRHYDDPFVGFSTTHPLFELNEAESVYRTSVSRQLCFGPQQFKAQKPEHGFRIFCLGGSTVRGRPFEVESAFPAWLQLELQACDPERDYEVVNCGGVSYASYRLRLIVDEVLNYQPDAIVVATGHNEFLEDRTYHDIKSQSAVRSWIVERANSLRTLTLARHWLHPDSGQRTILSEKVKARLDAESGYASYRRDDAWRAGVIEHFRRSVQAMVDACQARKVPIVLVDLGSNLRDCPPFKSEHKAGLSVKDEKAWALAFSLASDRDDANKTLRSAGPATIQVIEKTLSLYQEAEKIDDEYALLSYRMARCLERLGRYGEARHYYLRAQDCDICPLRMPEAEHKALQAIARDSKVPLVKVRERLARQSPQGIPGFESYLDHVHPTIANHQQIAQALLERMRQEGDLLPRAEKTWSQRERREAYREYIEKLPATFFRDCRRRIGWLENWARAHRLSKENVPINLPALLRQGHRHLELGQEEAAWQAYQTALVVDSTMSEPLLAHARALVSQGRPALARALVQELSQTPAASDWQPQCQLAQLVIALGEGQPRRAAELYAAHHEALHALEKTPNGWLDLMPDALQRAEQLLKAEQGPDES